MTTMEDINFRRNLDPGFRRKTNKNLLELNNLREEYDRKKGSLFEADELVKREKARLDDRSARLEEAQNALSDAQAEIDADYLPEGAQPRARIQKRDELALIVDQSEAAYQAQKKAMETATQAQITAEREFFNADRSLNRFAEGLEDVMQAKAIIEELDREK
jgi:predicted  nucleic acid-binding Zn-ribbon protein